MPGRRPRRKPPPESNFFWATADAFTRFCTYIVQITPQVDAAMRKSAVDARGEMQQDFTRA